MHVYEIHEDEFLLTSLTKACRLNNDVVTMHLCIRIFCSEEFTQIIYIGGQPYLALLFTTMLSTAYYGLFRVSEIAWTRNGHVVKAKDVQIASNKNIFLFLLRSSKTHGQELQPQLVKITSNGTVKSSKKLNLGRDKYVDTIFPYHFLRHYANM